MREGIERELQDEKEEKHGVERAQVTEARLQIELQLELAGVEENKTIIKQKEAYEKDSETDGRHDGHRIHGRNGDLM